MLRMSDKATALIIYNHQSQLVAFQNIREIRETS
tara:strand:+ start:961 stop:1062 length:102 start_codon:yes stop_codon:yes gene_type:complete